MSATRRLAVAGLAIVLAGLATMFPLAPATAQSTRVTFILVNDIYLMSDQMMPDGQRRGGFPRLAAVVKAERAKGGHVIFAHGGDTLSPSLMSGVDRGAHIINLTNMIRPDIFVPGNHEFDFGKATFLERMAEAQFPLYAANLRGPDGQQLPKFKDREIVTFDGVRIGLTGVAYDQTPVASSPEDLKFAPSIPAIKEQADTLRREGADFVVGVGHVTRTEGYGIVATRAVDLMLTGHTHDLFINFDGRTALVESSYDAHFVTVIDVKIDVKEEGGRRITTWWPQFRVIDTATVTPDPEVTDVVAKYERQLSAALDRPIGTTAVELDSRNATVRTREAAIGALIADAMRDSGNAEAAVTNGGGIRGGKVYPPGTPITRRDILAELPFDNRIVTVDISGADLKRAIENGLSRLPNPSGAFPQVSGLTIEADPSQPAGSRVLSMKVGNQPLDEARTYRVATNDFMARGGDGYTMFRDAMRLLPIDDSPLLAPDVMDYVQSIGTIRNVAGDRIILK
jgi:2',3'-cyclic-nucleotide 2'-phosphodiesterase (5'-nucleotidase family)